MVFDEPLFIFDLIPIFLGYFFISLEGLLALPAFFAFPAFTSGKECDKLLIGLTAASTARIFTRIPFLIPIDTSIELN